MQRRRDAAVRLGRAIALALAREGFAVAIHCNASRDKAEATAAEISALTGNPVIVAPADVRDPDAVARALDVVAERTGRAAPDIVVNNAAGKCVGRTLVGGGVMRRPQ